MSQKYTGECQCGNIRYEIVGTPNAPVVCHCTDCQRQSGSAFGMTLPVNEAEFRLTQGEVKTYASTSADVYFGRDTTIIERRRKIKDETVRKRRLAHQRQAA